MQEGFDKFLDKWEHVNKKFADKKEAKDKI
jgi:hypothetical protein